jgi:KDO2-lipid IV(A) lauroyltransferase
MIDAAGSLAIRTLELALALPPEPLALSAGRALGFGVHRGVRLRRSTVERQISRAFPDHPAAWVRRTSRLCYRHFGEELVHTVRFARTGPSAVLERTLDPEDLPRRHAETVSPGSGSIIVTGHLGNWELAGAYLAAVGLPIVAVVREQRGGVGDRLRALRSALGMETVGMREAPRVLARALSEGRTVALVADQHATAARGVPVPFFGRPAWTYQGPARLALACHVPLFFGALIRSGDNYRTILEPVEAPATSRPEEALTRGWVARLEDAVRDTPEQYFWFHRRWKAVPPASAEPGAGGDTGVQDPERTGRPERSRQANVLYERRCVT